MPAAAQDWNPERPVRIIMPFPPGGANANIGMDLAARAAPDGYTLGACTIGNCAINASIYARMPYDISCDLVPVFWSGSVMNVLVVRPDHPAQDFPQFLAWARHQGTAVNFSSSGFGSSNHLLPELLNFRLGLQLTHVPFRGGAPGMQAVMQGATQMKFENVPTLIGTIRGGQLRPLVINGRERDPQLPDVPTLAEVGVADAVAEP